VSLADEIGGEITAALIEPERRARAASTPALRDARADNRAPSGGPNFALQ
jgi:hypothetical protein